MESIELTKIGRFLPDRPAEGVLYDSEKLRVTLLCLEPGQEIPPYNASCDVLLYAVDGRGVFTIGEEELEVEAGSLAVAPADVVRGIKSQGRMVVLHAEALSPKSD